MRAVFLGSMPVFHSASDYLINRARRGELESQLSLAIAGALCVSSDAGEDHNKAREATALLHSLKAGGLLATIARDGHDYIEPAALLAVADRLGAAGLWGEGAQLWSGDVAARVGCEPLTTPELELALIGTAGQVRNKKGKAISWADFIRQDDFKEAAHAGKRGSRDTWRPSDARAFAGQRGYIFEKSMHDPEPASAAAKSGKNNAISRMVPGLKKG